LAVFVSLVAYANLLFPAVTVQAGGKDKIVKARQESAFDSAFSKVLE
jgi:hypothetical protein